MPLSLIVGPPNSGRAGEVRRRFSDALGRDPVLVVPTREDVERLERELCERDGASLGGAVLTFGSLFGEIARATGVASPQLLSDPQRLQAVRAAASRTRLRALRRSAARDGFAPALERLFGELQAAGIDPDGLARGVAERGGEPIESELSQLYRAYRELCTELGMGDGHDLAAAATAALRRGPEAWGRRPLFVYGFDDLTAEQLELLRVIADATEVCVAVTWEDRAALAARAGLLGELRELGATIELELGPQPGYTRSAILHHLERHLFEPAAPRQEPDPGLELLEAAGARAEAELIGGRIARLLSDGVAASEIVVVVRHPDADGPLLAEVLGRLAIPVAAEARVPFERTAVGRGLLALLRATYAGRAAADVLAFLRVPGRARPSDVDWLERSIRRDHLRTADEALAEWERRDGRAIWELEALHEARGDAKRLLAIARLAADIAEWPLRREAALPGPELRRELRAAATARASLEQLAALGAHAPGPAEAIRALESIRVPLADGPAGERVRIVSPYRVRAGRVRHLFVAGLQDGSFPDHAPDEPLIGDERRELLGLPARRAPADEERYLFHACVSRPTDVLYLSFRSVDEDGLAALPSPFLDDVRDLIAPPPPAEGPDPVVTGLTVSRGLGKVAFSPADAPNERELRRAIAAAGTEGGEAVVRGLDLPDEISRGALAACERARAHARPLPGPLRVPAVLEELGERRLYGASTLEEYLVCSYRWFVQHELDPESLEPRPEAMTQGGIVHAALERLYAEPPGDGPRPRPETIDAWRRRAAAIVLEIARERGIDVSRGASARVSVARMLALVERFLDTEAGSELSLVPDPELLEAAFGEGEENARPPLELGEFALHGQIDRIDVSTGPSRSALVRDYKLSRQVTAGANLEDEGKLQLPLYAIAARELWQLDPIGAVYHPLGARKLKDTRPRGLLAEEERDGLLPAGEFVKPDFVPAERLEEAMESARARATSVVRDMRAGEIGRNPREGRCPRWCSFQPICRRERAASLDAELEEEASSD
jgi:ATP-dependent helicase/DNAse subunit B